MKLVNHTSSSIFKKSVKTQIVQDKLKKENVRKYIDFNFVS